MKVWMMTIIFVSSGAFRILKTRKNASVVIPLSDAPIAEGGEPALFDDEGADVGKLGAEPSQAEVAPASETNDTNIQSCSCRIGMYSYQQWPKAQGRYGCIGGCGGSEFQINRAGVTIKELLVLTGDGRRRRAGHIKAIRFTYNDNHREWVGDPKFDASGPKEFKFQPGEYVVGDLQLSGNGKGEFLGSIEFETSAGNVFKVGLQKPQRYRFPSGDSYMAAFAGRDERNGVKALGVIFWKPIRDVTLGNLDYPTLNTLARMKSPAYIGSKTFCNANSFWRKFTQETLTKRVKEGSESCMKSTSFWQFGLSVKSSGGIPLVAQVEKEASWVKSESTERSNCKTKLVEEARILNFPGPNMAPFTKADWVFSQWQGTLRRLPFTAVARITFKDGTRIYRRESGTYEGVSFQKIKENFENEETNITSCR